MNAVSINNYELGVKELNQQRVVTLKDVDIVHQRPAGTARKRFNGNKKHFILGEDYFVRKTDEARKEYGISAPNGLTLLTETGYLMLVKSFTDDLAWEVQRKLVKSYFRAKEEQPEPVAIPETTIITKTYKGQTVLTVRDMTTLTGIHRDSINHYLRKYDMFVKGVDYLYISGLELQRFKHMNDGVSHMTNGLNLVTQKGARKIVVYSPNYSPEMEKQISRLYGRGQFENVLDEPQKQTDGEDLQQRYTRITEAQILMEAASKIDDPFYKEYVYKNVTAMMMVGSPKTGAANEDPAGVSFFYRLGALLASTDKKGRDDIRNKIIAELKSEGDSDRVVASANEFFILAESVLAE